MRRALLYRNFAGTPLGPGSLSLAAQVSSRRCPESSMGRAAYATLGCVYGYYRKLSLYCPLLYRDSV